MVSKAWESKMGSKEQDASLDCLPSGGKEIILVHYI